MSSKRAKGKGIPVTTILFICLLLFVMTFVYEQTFSEQALWSAARGVVVDREAEAYYNVTLELMDYRYKFTVRYTNDEGETVHSVIDTEIDEAAVGDTVDIIYAPDGSAAFGDLPENSDVQKLLIARYVLLAATIVMAAVWLTMRLRKKN